ncbi:MAG TPA: MFS transporter [Beijerinckiaceae bacterium]|jgi:MFS family permease|nr:MFS transporter [Beijerinckiaceae bacterium]
MSTDLAAGGEDTRLQHDLSREQVRVMGLATLGGMLEYYEFVVFIYLTPILSRLFFPADMPPWMAQLQVLAIFSVGYFVRPIGGIILAVLGDLFGRKRLFAVSLILMAVPTFLIGVLPTYAQVGILAPLLLLFCRLFQGIAIGGEIPGALVFMSEHLHERRLGIACGLMGSGLAIGGILASGFVALIIALPMQDQLSYGWRLPFILGGIFGLISAYLRRYVRETPVFEEMRRHKEKASTMPLRDLLRFYPRETLGCFVVATVPAAIVAGGLLYPVTYLQTFMHIDRHVIHDAAPWASAGLAIGTFVCGLLVDRFGAVRTIMSVAAAAIVAVYAFYLNVSNSLATTSTYFFFFGLLIGFQTMLYVVMIRSFPAPVRYTGIAVGYNLAAALVGGLSPVILGALAPIVPITPAHYVAFFALVAIVATPIIWRWRYPLAT